MNNTDSGDTARRVIVEGRVQGVFYRASTRDQARRRSVAGWVRNRDDGRVEAWLEGDTAAVQGLIDWMRRGPASARVTGLSSDPAPVRGYTDFDIV